MGWMASFSTSKIRKKSDIGRDVTSYKKVHCVYLGVAVITGIYTKIDQAFSGCFLEHKPILGGDQHYLTGYGEV